MLHPVAIAFVLLCLAGPVWAQVQSVAVPATKPAVKKPAAKPQTAKQSVGPADGGPCQIGVIPAIGDEFVYQRIGFTVFGNERTEVPIKGWGLDDLVVARVRAAAGPAVTVRKIAYNKDALAGQGQPSGLLFRGARTALNTTVQQLAGNAGCGRYVLVTRMERQFTGNQTIQGIGILNTGNTVVGSTLLFATTYIRVFDGRDFTITKQRAASINDNPSAVSDHLGLGVPTKRLDTAAFPDTPTQAANDPTIRDGARALLVTSLDRTLPVMLAP
jgi:hypothetical protein